MFHPRSIALIGVSSELTKLSGRPFRFFREGGYKGKLYPVNPKYKEIEGVPCFESVADIPDQVDLAVITLPAPAVPAALAACGEKGVKAAAIISSGFAEIGGEGVRLQEVLRQIALKHNMAICGPNCSGFLYVPESVTATFSVGLDKGMARSGPLAFVSQSGALSSYILGAALERSLGFTYWITTGNECVLGFSDYVAYVLEDPQVRLVLGYLEEARDGETFKTCARRALSLDKPLIILKVGRTEVGAKASLSHTGSMVGSDEVYAAVFSQNGVIRADNLDELFDLATLAMAPKRAAGKRVQILSISGGAGILMADVGTEMGLEFRDLSPATKEELKKFMPPFATLSNPMDMTAELVARPGLLGEAAQIISADPQVDTVVIFLGILTGSYDRLATDIASVARNTDKLVMVNWFPMPPLEAQQILRQAGVPLFPEPARGIKVLGKIVGYVETRKRLLAETAGPIIGEHRETERVANILKQAEGEKRLSLSEAEAKRLLKAWGLPVPRGGVVKTAKEAQSLAREIGWPVVMKVSSPDLMHKTEAGVVKLGVATPDEVERTFDEIMTKARRYNSEARLDGVLVEEMVTGDVREMIVGAKQDPCFGPVVTVGLGGIFVEAVRDFVVWPAPLTLTEARELIKQIRGYRILTAFRGRLAADVDALAQALCRLGALADQFREVIAEVEINPLFVLAEGKGAIVGDALVVVKSGKAEI